VTTTRSREPRRQRSGGSFSEEMELFVRKFIQRLEPHAVETGRHLGPDASYSQRTAAMARAILETFDESGTDFQSALEFFRRAAEESPPTRGRARRASKPADARAPDRRRADPNWSEAKNARRCELIDRKIQDKLSTEESAELHDLQEAFRAYLDRVAPIPMEGARELHAKLLRRRKKGVMPDAGV
jgi:hypothetical protein